MIAPRKGRAINRASKSRTVKAWSFRNQQIIFRKFWRMQSFKNKLAIIWYNLKMIVFILLFERYLLKEFSDLRLVKNEIKRKSLGK